MKAILSNAAVVALFAAALLTKMPELVSMSVALGWILLVLLAVAGVVMFICCCCTYADRDDPSAKKRASDLLTGVYSQPRLVRWVNMALTAAMVALLAAMGAVWTAVAFGIAWLVIATPCLMLSRGLLEAVVAEASPKS